MHWFRLPKTSTDSYFCSIKENERAESVPLSKSVLFLSWCYEPRATWITVVISRGGVEDTRLEAKARTQKNPVKAKNRLSEDRPSRGQGHECSRPKPRTKDIGASVLKRKKRSSKFFQAISKKQGLQIFFSGDQQNFNNSKNTAVLEPRTGQFSRTWGFEAKAKDIKNMSSSTPPLVIRKI